MKLSVRIAARRRLRRMEEDRPFFNTRIVDFSESQRAFAMQFFEKALDKMKSEFPLGI